MKEQWKTIVGFEAYEVSDQGQVRRRVPSRTTLKTVLEQYHSHVLKLAKKKPSVNQRKGIAYYTASAERVQALIDAPTPQWVGLQFKRSITL
jgi:hypothetical protein